MLVCPKEVGVAALVFADACGSARLEISGAAPNGTSHIHTAYAVRRNESLDIFVHARQRNNSISRKDKTEYM